MTTAAPEPAPDPSWIADRAEALIIAARAGTRPLMYEIGREIAARTLQATELFRLVSDHAGELGDWDEAVRFATLVRMADPADPARAVALVRLLKRARRFEIARSVAAGLQHEVSAVPEIALLPIEIALAERDDARLAAALDEAGGCAAAARRSFFDRIVAILSDAERFDAVERALAIGIERHGDAVEFQRARATLAYRRGRFDEADAHWRGLEHDPRFARAAFMFRARIASRREDREGAEALYERALQLEPQNAEAISYVVRRRLRDGTADEAAERLATRVAATGEDAVALWLAALITAARRDYGGATAQAEAALRRFPSDAALALRIADLHIDIGDAPTAGAVLDRALETHPQNFPLLARRVRVADQGNEAVAARLALARRALAVRPNDESMLRAVANLLARSGDRRAAIEAAVRALDDHPRQVAFWRTAIANLLNLSEPAAAGALVERAREVFGSDAPADRAAMTDILEVAERSDEALAAARAALAAKPGDATARAQAARLAVALGRYGEALEDLEALQGMVTRSGPEAALRARVATSLAYVGPQARDAAFPDAVIAKIARTAPRMAWDEAAPVVLHVTAGMGAGGAERQLALTLRGQANRAETGGLRPVLAAGDLNPVTGRDFFMRDVLAAGVETVHLSERRAAGAPRDLTAADPDHRANSAILAALPQEMAAIALPLYGELIRLRPRVCHLWQDTTSIAGALAAALAGTPRIVIGTRSTRPVERQRARSWLKPGYLALLARPGVIALNNSRNGARDYEDWLGLPAGRITPVYNGYEFASMQAKADPARAAEIRSELGAAPDDPVFGGVMRLSFEKRPELWTAAAIALARRLPNLRCALVGDGPMRAQLLDTIAEAGLSARILLVGRQSPVEPWMKAMDALFLSSLTEGLPNVLIEAQSLGIAVASMRVGGAPETIDENRTGLLIDGEDADAIADAILPLLADRRMRARFGAAAVDWTQRNFSDKTNLDRLAALYVTEPA